MKLLPPKFIEQNVSGVPPGKSKNQFASCICRGLGVCQLVPQSEPGEAPAYQMVYLQQPRLLGTIVPQKSWVFHPIALTTIYQQDLSYQDKMENSNKKKYKSTETATSG